MLLDLFTPAHKSQSLDELRDSLKEDQTTPRDFITILEDHHDYLEYSIKILMNPKSELTDKRAHLTRFISLVHMHGHAEEKTLYVSLERNGDKEARVEGFGGQDEHAVAYQIIDQIKALNYLTNWSDELEAKAVRVAGLVKNHIAEEEGQMFKIAQKQLSEQELQTLASEYIQKCHAYLRDETSFTKKGNATIIQPGTF